MKKNLILILLIVASFNTLTLKAQNSDGTKSEEIIFKDVNEEITFKGGLKKWQNFLARNLDGNTPAKLNAPPGTYPVKVNFTIDQFGKVIDVSAESNHGYGMEKEVVRVIKKSPDWEPFVQNGENVKVRRKQLFVFVVNY